MWLDRLADEMQALVRPARPAWAPPMLAVHHEGGLPGGEWIFERKFDGHRVAAINDEKVRFITGDGIDVTNRYPEIVDALPKDHVYVLDGEIVAFVGGRDSLAALESRTHAQYPELCVPAYFLAFDILHLDGQDLTALPLASRRGILQGIGLRGRTAVVPGTLGDAETLMDGASSAGWKGLIAKRLDSPYEHHRSPHWRKLKCLRTGDFVIGGYTAPRGMRTGFGALLLGAQKADGLHYVGKVGTGFNEMELRALHGALERLRRDGNPFVDAPLAPATWVEPVLTCRVDFTERTKDGRLRHARFAGLRRRQEAPFQETSRSRSTAG